MKVKILLALLFILTAFVVPEKKKLKIFLAGDSTMSVKESKAFPETGWGMPFAGFWDSTVIVENRARNGRSTRTFISEGLWQSIVDQLQKGDYVFIQFGHNDESKEKTERYTTIEQFKANLTRFVNETRNKKAHPVLLTPVTRRRFDSNGNILETHIEYSAATSDVARLLNVPLIDLDKKSRELLQQFGKETSRLLFLQLKPGEHPNYPDGRDDNTHFNELGARLIAQIVLKEIREMDKELSERIIKRIQKK